MSTTGTLSWGSCRAVAVIAAPAHGGPSRGVRCPSSVKLRTVQNRFRVLETKERVGRWISSNGFCANGGPDRGRATPCAADRGTVHRRWSGKNNAQTPDPTQAFPRIHDASPPFRFRQNKSPDNGAGHALRAQTKRLPIMENFFNCERVSPPGAVKLQPAGGEVRRLQTSPPFFRRARLMNQPNKSPGWVSRTKPLV